MSASGDLNELEVTITNNVVISDSDPGLGGLNFFFNSRDEAGIEPYPKLPVPKN